MDFHTSNDEFDYLVLPRAPLLKDYDIPHFMERFHENER